MKIYILSDEQYLGGASICNQHIKEELEKRGHTVTIHTINQTENTWKKDMSADWYIIGNFAYIPKEDLDELFYEKKVIRIFHDIPGYMYQPKTVKFEKYYNLMQYMLNNAKLNIFISPLQAKTFNNFFSFKDINFKITPPTKDMSNFKITTKLEDRKKDILYLGDISNARGIVESIQIAKQNKLNIDFVGPFVDKELVKNLKDNNFNVTSEMPNENVPLLMNQYKYFIYYPNLIDSFCFKIVEAELCGCEIIADKYRIGRYYYKENISDIVKLINETPKIIADYIENGTNK